MEKIFVCFGKNEKLRDLVCDFLEESGYEPICLVDCKAKGLTLIEKIEEYSDVSKALVILSGDDTIKPYRSRSEGKKYPRQNVVFEYGYFMALLGRKNVIAIADSKRRLDLLSDCHSLSLIIVDSTKKNRNGRWKKLLLAELE